MAVFPPWVAPDEPGHFEAIRVLGQEQQLPSFEYYESSYIDLELAKSIDNFRVWEFAERPNPNYGLSDSEILSTLIIDYPNPGGWIFVEKYPVLPHLLLSPFLYLSSSFDVITQLYLLRIISVFLAVLMIVVTWLIIRRIFPEEPQFWLAIPAFLVFFPMRTHIFAAVNTDTFAILLTSSLLLLFISLFDGGLSKLKVILIILLLVLTLLIKRTVVFVGPWGVVVMILYFGYRQQWAISKIIRLGLIGFGGVSTIFVLMILNADFLASLHITLFKARVLGTPYIVTLINQGATLTEIFEAYLNIVKFAILTFWGVFGYNNINIPLTWSWVLTGIGGIILAGTSLYLFEVFSARLPVTTFQRNVFIIFLVGAFLGIVSAFIPSFFSGLDWGPQARYYFPVLIPIATFLYLGVWRLCPAKYRQTYLLPVWLMSWIVYDFLVMTTVLLPFFYF